jgi:hypothetical protein
MPAPIISSSSANSSQITAKSQTKKNVRAVRRRGRAREDLSDDEVERAALTDSDSEPSSSHLHSDSDAESESVQHSSPATPHPAVPPHLASTVSRDPGPSHDARPKLNGRTPSLQPPTDWSDMVTAEDNGDVSTLPVIDFTDLSSHAGLSSQSAEEHLNGSGPINGAPLTSTPPPTTSIQPSSDPSTSNTAARASGQTPRQAYLHRLSTDPSYVPRVGAFWGHDERLLDKDLRGLSGWWRGKWSGRGRGFGRGEWGPRGRGRGRGGFGFGPGFNGPPPNLQEVGDNQPQSAVEQTWTHDGFEEIKQEETRQPPPTDTRGGGRGGRGWSRGSTRGGRGGGLRRGNSPAGSNVAVLSVASPVHQTPPLRPTPSTQKPSRKNLMERPYTRPIDDFAYNDWALRPKAGVRGQGVRIKLPGHVQIIARTPAKSSKEARIRQRPASSAAEQRSETGSEKQYIVRLPSFTGSVNGPSSSSPLAGVENVTVAGDPLDPPSMSNGAAHSAAAPSPNSIRVRLPKIPPAEPSKPSLPSTDMSAHDKPAQSRFFPSHAATTAIQQAQRQQLSEGAPVRPPLSKELEQLQGKPEAPKTQAAPEVAVSTSQAPDSDFVVQPPETRSIPTFVPTGPLAPSVPPPAVQPSPYPYAYASYAMPLPPGIGITENGVYYEIATGRAVVLNHPTPPPIPPMYTPRPMLHSHMVPRSGSVSFLPHHIPAHHTISPHHPLTPDYHNAIGHPNASTPPIPHGAPNGYSFPQFNPYADNSEHPPIFVPPRSRGRIEIRAPSEGTESPSTADQSFATIPGSKGSTTSDRRTSSQYKQPAYPTMTQHYGTTYYALPPQDQNVAYMATPGSDDPAYSSAGYYPATYGYYPSEPQYVPYPAEGGEQYEYPNYADPAYAQPSSMYY